MPDVHHTDRHHIDRWGAILGALALVALVSAALTAITGGFDTSVAGIRLAAREPYRAYSLGVLLGAAALWRIDRRSIVPSWEGWLRLDAHRAPVRVLVGAAAALVVAAGIRFGAFVAGGADAYGYVSEALLWRSGQLITAEPLARLTPAIGGAVAPLGYQLVERSGEIVPIYPPGFPLLLALAITLGGFSAAFLVVPLLAGVAVWLTWIVGARIGGARVGLMAAALLACSPIFLLQVMGPMSDVPATAFWLAALATAILGRGGPAAFACGLAAAAAVLIRPNLVPLAGLVGLFVIASGSSVRRGIAFAAGVVPGIAAVAAFNWTLFGSPLTSGYGTNATLFSVGWLGTNLRHYPAWMFQLESPFVFLGLLAPVLPAGSDEIGSVGIGVHRLSAGLLLFVAVVLACYLVYIPFDHWSFLRFLLPAIPLLLILSGATAVWLISRTPVRLRGAIFLALLGLLCGRYVDTAVGLNIFHNAASQHRYIVVADYVDRELPRNALVITVLHSGSIRFYGHRPTLRWQLIEPDALDRVVQTVRANGYLPFILLEGSEEAEFRAKFARTNAGTLDAAPIAEYDSYERVRIYSLDGPAMAGSQVETVRIHP